MNQNGNKWRKQQREEGVKGEIPRKGKKKNKQFGCREEKVDRCGMQDEKRWEIHRR